MAKKPATPLSERTSRSLFRQGYPIGFIAKFYGVSRETIYNDLRAALKRTTRRTRPANRRGK